MVVTWEVPFLDLRVLMCRFRRVDEWRGAEKMAAFWRFYWNPQPGAWLECDDGRIDLVPDHQVLIPPHTPFRGMHEAPFDHFFIHFILGDTYRIDDPQVYVQAAEGPQLTRMVDALQPESACSVPMGMEVHALLLRSLQSLDPALWRAPVQDARIRQAVTILMNNLADPPGNERLAGYFDLHVNSFVRLFSAQVGLPPHRYVLQQRVDRAVQDLIHGRQSVERIAHMWGFTDRQHLTRTLKRLRGVTPGELRRRNT